MDEENIIRDRSDYKRWTGERLETLLLEGLHSGNPIEVNEDYWRKKKSRIEEQHKAKLAGKLQ